MSIESFDHQIEKIEAELKNLRDKEAEIVAQLAVAKMQARERGEYANSTWFRRATTALQKTRADIDQRQRAVKLLYRRWSYLRQSSFEARFLQHAKSKLPSEIFRDMVAEINAEMMVPMQQEG
jgi:hypothetical protein